MPESKTKPTQQSATAFIHGLDDKQRRADAKKVASILYIKSLADVDEKVLEQLIIRSVKYMRKNYPTKGEIHERRHYHFTIGRHQAHS